MIVHTVGTDTVVSYDWRDDNDAPVVITSASFIAERSGSTGVDWTELDAGLVISGDYTVSLTLPHALVLDPGNYTYSLVVQAAGVVTLLSAGLLRVR